jgi:hypothetical protein
MPAFCHSIVAGARLAIADLGSNAWPTILKCDKRLNFGIGDGEGGAVQ